MRNEKRIPIVLKHMCYRDILSKFLKTESLHILNRITNNWELIEKSWEENPDLRFGQLLSNLGLVSEEIESHAWNIEEDNWLINNGYINIEDIKFWGNNFYKNGNKRKTTKFILLKDLKTDHIENIIEFFSNQNAFNSINTSYLEYFNKRINE